MLRLSYALGAFLLTIALAGNALAAKAPDNSQLFEMIKALQARVTALEQQNRAYRQEVAAARNDADSARLRLASLTQDDPPTSAARPPMRIGAPTPVPGTVVTPAVHADRWSGLYFGTSFGLGATSASSRVQGIATLRTTTTGQGLVGPDTQESFSAVGGTDHNEGALVDLYIGYNKHITPRAVAGIQIEGTLSQLDFSSRVTGSRFSRVQFNSPSVSSFVFTEKSSVLNRIEAEWMVSALARGGLLATPSTLVYGLAGLAYGTFELSEIFPASEGLLQDGFQTTPVGRFEKYGLSVGAGIEKRLSPHWSLRGEYRYTRFHETDFEESNDFTRIRTQAQGTFSQVHSLSAVSNFENEMHIGRIGITRYLGKRR